MPVEKLNIDGLKIRNLRLGTTANGKFTLSFSCLHASSYVLCFGSGDLLGCGDVQQDLCLTENDLKMLAEGQTLYKMNKSNEETYRLQGVTKAMLGGTTAFQNFTVAPPEQIQVWSMLHDQSSGKRTLYVPAMADKNSCCFAPLRYDVELSSTAEGKSVRVVLGAAEQEKYQDGSLNYSVDGSCPIPIPKKCINKSFTIPCGIQSNVVIKAAPAYDGKYEQIKK